MDKARKILVNTVGEEEAAILTTGQATREDIEKVQQKYRDKENTIRNAEAQAKAHIADAADRIRDHTNQVIGWIEDEKTKWWELIFVIMQYMGVVEAASHIKDNLVLSQGQAQLQDLEEQRDRAENDFDNAKWRLPGQTKEEYLAELDSQIDNLKQWNTDVDSKIKERLSSTKSKIMVEAAEQMNQLKGSISSSSSPEHSRTEAPTGGDDGKHHGGGHHKEEDPEKKEAKELKERYEAYRKSLELTSKDIETRYKRSLDDVSDREKLHGETIESMTEN